MAKVVIHTDGSSKGNPGPGGWSAIIETGSEVLEMGGSEEKTTNNKMELTAAIEALKIVNQSAIESSKSGFSEEIMVEINTDSEYLIKGITMWIWGWMKKGWKTASKDPVLNQELWEALYDETKKRKVEWKKVAGHSGHKLNDRCDEIAQTLADGIKMDLYNGPKENYSNFLNTKR